MKYSITDLDEILKYIKGDEEFLNKVETFDLISRHCCDFLVIGGVISLCFGNDPNTAITLITGAATYRSQVFSPLITNLKKLMSPKRYNSKTLAIDTYLRYETAYKILKVLAIKDILRDELKEVEDTQKELYIVNAEARKIIEEHIRNYEETKMNSYTNLMEESASTSGQIAFWEIMIQYFSKALIHDREYLGSSISELQKHLLDKCRKKMEAYVQYLSENHSGFMTWYNHLSTKITEEKSPIDFRSEYELFMKSRLKERKKVIQYPSIVENIGLSSLIGSFKFSSTWGEEAKQIIEQLNEELPYNPLSLGKIDQRFHSIVKKMYTVSKMIHHKSIYKEIQEELKELREDFYTIFNDLEEKDITALSKIIKRYIDNLEIVDQPFRRVFLLAGDPGSGKTHQVIDFIAVEGEDKSFFFPYYFFMETNEYSSSRSIEDWVLACMIKSLKIDSTLSTNIFRVYKNNRVFIIIENLEALIKKDATFVDKLWDYIDKTTQHNNVYFCISISYYSIYKVLKKTNRYLDFILQQMLKKNIGLLRL